MQNRTFVLFYSSPIYFYENIWYNDSTRIEKKFFHYRLWRRKSGKQSELAQVYSACQFVTDLKYVK